MPVGNELVTPAPSISTVKVSGGSESVPASPLVARESLQSRLREGFMAGPREAAARGDRTERVVDGLLARDGGAARDCDARGPTIRCLPRADSPAPQLELTNTSTWADAG